VNVVLGAWLLATAFVAGPQSPEFGDHLFLGLAVFLVAFLAMGLPAVRFANVFLGAWTALSPLVFHYAGQNMAVNDVVVGVLVAWFAFSPAPPPRRHRLGDAPI
jgi:hypothetical protein